MGITLREARLRRHLVVLDDDELIGAFVRQVAEEIGYQVTATTSPEVFLAAVSEHAKAAGAGTIVLRDLHSADIELAEAIRERGYVKTSLPASMVYDPVVGGD